MLVARVPQSLYCETAGFITPVLLSRGNQPPPPNGQQLTKIKDALQHCKTTPPTERVTGNVIYKYTQPLHKYGYICNGVRQFGDTNVTAHRAVRGAINK